MTEGKPLRLGDTFVEGSKYFWVVPVGDACTLQKAAVDRDMYDAVKNLGYLNNVLLWADKYPGLPDEIRNRGPGLFRAGVEARQHLIDSYIYNVLVCATLEKQNYDVQGLDKERLKSDCVDSITFIRRFYGDVKAFTTKFPSQSAWTCHLDRITGGPVQGFKAPVEEKCTLPLAQKIELTKKEPAKLEIIVQIPSIVPAKEPAKVETSIREVEPELKVNVVMQEVKPEIPPTEIEKKGLTFNNLSRKELYVWFNEAKLYSTQTWPKTWSQEIKVLDVYESSKYKSKNLTFESLLAESGLLDGKVKDTRLYATPEYLNTYAYNISMLKFAMVGDLDRHANPLRLYEKQSFISNQGDKTNMSYFDTTTITSLQAVASHLYDMHTKYSGLERDMDSRITLVNSLYADGHILTDLEEAYIFYDACMDDKTAAIFTDIVVWFIPLIKQLATNPLVLQGQRLKFISENTEFIRWRDGALLFLEQKREYYDKLLLHVVTICTIRFISLVQLDLRTSIDNYNNNQLGFAALQGIYYRIFLNSDVTFKTFQLCPFMFGSYGVAHNGLSKLKKAFNWFYAMLKPDSFNPHGDYQAYVDVEHRMTTIFHEYLVDCIEFAHRLTITKGRELDIQVCDDSKNIISKMQRVFDYVKGSDKSVYAVIYDDTTSLIETLCPTNENQWYTFLNDNAIIDLYESFSSERLQQLSVNDELKITSFLQQCEDLVMSYLTMFQTFERRKETIIFPSYANEWLYSAFKYVSDVFFQQTDENRGIVSSFMSSIFDLPLKLRGTNLDSDTTERVIEFIWAMPSRLTGNELSIVKIIPEKELVPIEKTEVKGMPPKMNPYERTCQIILEDMGKSTSSVSLQWMCDAFQIWKTGTVKGNK
jgi:hypothetical protein